MIWQLKIAIWNKRRYLFSRSNAPQRGSPEIPQLHASIRKYHSGDRAPHPMRAPTEAVPERGNGNHRCVDYRERCHRRGAQQAIVIAYGSMFAGEHIPPESLTDPETAQCDYIPPCPVTTFRAKRCAMKRSDTITTSRTQITKPLPLRYANARLMDIANSTNAASGK